MFILYIRKNDPNHLIVIASEDELDWLGYAQEHDPKAYQDIVENLVRVPIESILETRLEGDNRHFDFT